jgi:hypothetical protein
MPYGHLDPPARAGGARARDSERFLCMSSLVAAVRSCPINSRRAAVLGRHDATVTRKLALPNT